MLWISLFLFETYIFFNYWAFMKYRKCYNFFKISSSLISYILTVLTLTNTFFTSEDYSRFIIPRRNYNNYLFTTVFRFNFLYYSFTLWQYFHPPNAHIIIIINNGEMSPVKWMRVDITGYYYCNDSYSIRKLIHNRTSNMGGLFGCGPFQKPILVFGVRRQWRAA